MIPGTSPIDNVLSRLHGVQKTPNGWDALCPAHGDSTPSLGIAVGHDGAVLLRCRSAGCSADEICKSIGLKLCDLFPRANGNGHSKRIVATYGYRDESGKLLFEVVRFEQKDFRQRRPDGQGDWIWKLGDVPRVPYRLPELLGDPFAPVFIVEGEKDADRLAAEELQSTCNAGGAGKWHTLCATSVRRAFAGRGVVILPDNDQPGRVHAEHVALALHGIADSIKILALSGLSEKGDVSDWLQSHSRDELLDLADVAPEWTPRARGDTSGPRSESNRPSGYRFNPIDSATLKAREYKLKWLVKRLLVANQLAVVGAARKTLKTCMMIDLALSLGSGQPLLGYFDVYCKRRVALISGESGEYTLKETALRICAAKAIDLADADVLWDFALPQLANPEHVAELAAGLKRHAVEVLVVDPLYLCLLTGVGADGINAANLYQVGPLLLAINRACLDAGATLILVHHVTKMATRRTQQEGGSLTLDDLAYSGIAEAVRQWVLIWARDPFDPATGCSRLTLGVGGSAGQCGEWAVDVEEGVIDDSFTGRKWDVKVTPSGKLKNSERDAKTEAKREAKEKRDAADDMILMGVIDRESKEGSYVGYTNARQLSDLPSDRMARCVVRLKQGDLVEEGTCEIEVGNGAKRLGRGLRRKSERTSVGKRASVENGLSHQTNDVGEHHSSEPPVKRVSDVCMFAASQNEERTADDIRPMFPEPADGPYEGRH